MVLAELTGRVAERLKQVGNGRVFRLESERRAGHSNLRQAGAKRVLSGNKGGAPGGAALLAVVVGEGDAFIGNAVEIRGSITHHAATEITDIPSSDVVSPQDQDIGFLCGHTSFLSLDRF